jgi:hypothetical protein
MENSKLSMLGVSLEDGKYVVVVGSQSRAQVDKGHLSTTLSVSLAGPKV